MGLLFLCPVSSTVCAHVAVSPVPYGTHREAVLATRPTELLGEEAAQALAGSGLEGTQPLSQRGSRDSTTSSKERSPQLPSKIPTGEAATALLSQQLSSSSAIEEEAAAEAGAVLAAAESPEAAAGKEPEGGAGGATAAGADSATTEAGNGTEGGDGAEGGEGAGDGAQEGGQAAEGAAQEPADADAESKKSGEVSLLHTRGRRLRSAPSLPHAPWPAHAAKTATGTLALSFCCLFLRSHACMRFGCH